MEPNYTTTSSGKNSNCIKHQHVQNSMDPRTRVKKLCLGGQSLQVADSFGKGSTTTENLYESNFEGD